LFGHARLLRRKGEWSQSGRLTSQSLLQQGKFVMAATMAFLPWHSRLFAWMKSACPVCFDFVQFHNQQRGASP
jgi:hypothetical protein